MKCPKECKYRHGSYGNTALCMYGDWLLGSGTANAKICPLREICILREEKRRLKRALFMGLPFTKNKKEQRAYFRQLHRDAVKKIERSK